MNLFAEQIPFFLCFLSIGLLISLKETFLLLLYFGGFLANGLLNQYLKPIIQDGGTIVAPQVFTGNPEF